MLNKITITDYLTEFSDASGADLMIIEGEGRSKRGHHVLSIVIGIRRRRLFQMLKEAVGRCPDFVCNHHQTRQFSPPLEQ